MTDPNLMPARFLAVVSIAALLCADVASGCIYSATECQCARRPSGNVCLRYHSGAPGDEECQSYLCGKGFHCDCSGSMICDIKNCARPGGSFVAYRPRGRSASAIGQLVPCERYEKTICIVPRGPQGLVPLLSHSSMSPTPSSSSSPLPSTSSSPAPSSSASPTPSASVSPTPSSSTSPTPSSSVSPTPSSSVSPTPSSSFSPTPSSSVSPTPSTSASTSVTPSPSPFAILPLGAACAPAIMNGTGCGPRLACDCAGVCARKMDLEIRAVADDQALPFICGKALQPPSPNHYTAGTWKYSGACVMHVIFETENWGGSDNALGAGLKMDIAGVGKTGWVLTKMGMGGMVAQDPKDMSFLTNERFDFAASPEWRPVVRQTLLLRFRDIRNFLATIGNPDLWAYRNARNLPRVKIWYMMPNPKCPKRW